MYMAGVKKEAGVKLFIKGQEVQVKYPVRHKFDVDGNLTIWFKIGANGQDDVKLIFDKREYFDSEDDK
jgi:hypothetical protein